jgi:hypothetical protein
MQEVQGEEVYIRRRRAGHAFRDGEGEGEGEDKRRRRLLGIRFGFKL